jgi:hypothetical protein
LDAQEKGLQENEGAATKEKECLSHCCNIGVYFFASHKSEPEGRQEMQTPEAGASDFCYPASGVAMIRKNE